MQIKKITSLVAAAVFCVAAASAVNYGGKISNNSKFRNTVLSDGDLKADQANSASLWFKAPFTSAGTSYFLVQGSAKYEKDFDLVDDATVFLNIDVFKVELNKELSSSNLIVQLGRFANFDLTEKILAQQCDGAGIKFVSSAVNAWVYGGCTGLLNAGYNSILSENLTEYAYDSTKYYDFAKNFALAKAGIELPNILLNQTVKFEGIVTIKIEQGDFNQFDYGTVLLNGALTNNLYYTLSSTIEAISLDADGYDYANLSSLDVEFLTDVKSFFTTLNAVYASGKFKGFSSASVVESNRTTPEEYNKLLKAGLTAGFRPFTPVLLTAGADAIFTPYDTIEYRGAQCSVKADCQLTSDFYLGAAFTQYVDKDDSDFNKTTVELKAALIF